jgi:cytoskeletal protein CcmA (bactofilin family)
MYKSNNGGFTVPYPSSGRVSSQSSIQTGFARPSISTSSNIPQPTGISSQGMSVKQQSAQPARSVSNAEYSPRSISSAPKTRVGLGMSRPPLSVSSQEMTRREITETTSMFTADGNAARKRNYQMGTAEAVESAREAAKSRTSKSLFSKHAEDSLAGLSSKEQEARKARYVQPLVKAVEAEENKVEAKPQSRFSSVRSSAELFTSKPSIKKETTQQEGVVMMNSSNVAMRDMDDMQNAYGAGSPRRVVDVNPNSSNGYSSSRRAKSAGNNKLIVGADIKLNGDISSCEELVVEGVVEANLTDTGTVEVAESGHFKGSAEVDVADISGVFEGNLTARENLFVRSTGRIVGNIKYTTIVVEPGGVIDGVVEISKSI